MSRSSPKSAPVPTPSRRNFTEEFRRDAVQMLFDGHIATLVAERLGICPSSLSRWSGLQDFTLGGSTHTEQVIQQVVTHVHEHQQPDPEQAPAAAQDGGWFSNLMPSWSDNGAQPVVPSVWGNDSYQQDHSASNYDPPAKSYSQPTASYSNHDYGGEDAGGGSVSGNYGGGGGVDS